MKAVKILLIAALVYAGIVVAFETLIGTLQPTPEGTIVITTTEPDGTTYNRVVTKLESDGQLYVAVNHWPRAWFERAVANPDVRVTMDGTTSDFRAVQVTGAEFDRVNTEHALPFVFRVLTGFPPRLLLRLDPRAPAPTAS
jgi:hypothetical protein